MNLYKTLWVLVPTLALLLGVGLGRAHGQQVSGAGAPEQIPLEKVYSVQLGAFSSSGECDNYMEELLKDGSVPVFSVVDPAGPYPHKARVGLYDNYLDALESRDLLRADGFPNAFLVWASPQQAIDSWGVVADESDLEQECRENALALPAFFDPATPRSRCGATWGDGKSPNKSDVLRQAPALESIELQMNGNPTSDTLKAVETLLAETSDTDARKGILNVAAARYRQWGNKDFRAALPMYEAVAKGIVAAPKETRLESMVEAADIHHYFRGTTADRLTAYKAYKDSLEFSKNLSPKTQARVWLEIIGLRMELARSAKGELSECRREIARFLAAVDASYGKDRAVARLMDLECVYWKDQKDPDLLVLIPAFLKEERQYMREYSTALTLLAAVHYEWKNYDEATKALDEVMALEITDSDQWTFKYDRWNVKLKAANMGLEFAKQFNVGKDIPKWTEAVRSHKASSK